MPPEAKAETLKDHQDQKPLLRELDQKQKQVLSLFEESRFITTKELADFLHIHRRTALYVYKNG